LATIPSKTPVASTPFVDAVGSEALFMTCDANRGWTTAQALRFIREIEDVDTYVEQPCDTISEFARIRSQCSQPLIIDESAREFVDVLSAIVAGCADGVNIKPVRVGGLTKAARIRDLALEAGLMIMVDEPQGADLATAGMVQLAATVSPQNFLGVSYFAGEQMMLSYKAKHVESGSELQGGEVVWNRAPGLGLIVDEEIFGEPIFVCTADRN
jgi:cis-L-3-hydroxyproline dehydratase